MGLIKEEKIRNNTLREIAQKMLIAARTAPKGRGEDTTVLALVEGDEIKRISEKLKKMGEEYNVPAFIRDAENIRYVSVMILLGTKIKSLGLKKCGMCGFDNCEEKEKHPHNPCVFNTGDLGIAIGSAVSVAMNHRVDNRIMYTVGQAVMAMGLLGDDIKVAYGIPLSATSKNPFFDRK
ncbi:MAG: ferredoxin [Candidatus Omnitrophica bacterium]|nr:ferredoxin [Candidatus Omnitrophota bacterium]